VASIPGGAQRAFLSSGTWSLLGTEIGAPIITKRSRDLNFTNEGGVSGTTRLLKNIAGMWLLQACRRTWASEGHAFEYDELLSMASEDRHAFKVLFDPDHPGFLHPTNMVAAIDEYCRETGQAAPDGPGGHTRAILESLAFKYRFVIDALHELTGHEIEEIQIVGGGSRNRLLNQFTADATGCTVLAGPVEATALGNLALQMVGTGAVDSLDHARRIIERSFPVERFVPADSERWDSQYRRFQQYLELNHVSEEPLGRPRSRPPRIAAARAAALSLESPRRRPADHQLRRRQHQLEVRSPRSAHGCANPRDGGQRQRRRSALDRHVGVRGAVPGQAGGVDQAVSG
jgi:rhamnulokinase